MKIRTVFMLFAAMVFILGIGSQASSDTLDCYDLQTSTFKGSVRGIPSSTSHSLFPEICNQHISSCSEDCFGRL